jgi:hypothetical protein
MMLLPRTVPRMTLPDLTALPSLTCSHHGLPRRGDRHHDHRVADVHHNGHVPGLCASRGVRCHDRHLRYPHDEQRHIYLRRLVCVPLPRFDVLC